MSLYGSLFSGVTGLNAQSLALGDISENIANVNTVGFKSSTTQFATLVSGGEGSVGGVKHIATQKNAAQGILQQTTSSTDLGISGAGFFVVNDNVQDSTAVGQTQFTRAGHFSLDEDLNLVNQSGLTLMGWKVNATGEFVDVNNNVITPDPTSDADLLPVSLGDVAFSSQATTSADIQASFPADMTVADEFKASVRVVDELSVSHSLAFDFTTADHVELIGSLDDGTNGVVNFQIQDIPTPAALDDGTLASVTAIDLDFTSAGIGPDGEALWDIVVTADNGTVSGATGTFQIAYDVEGNIIGDEIRQIDVAWDGGGLVAADSIIALDFSSVTFDGAVAPTLDETDGGFTAPLVNAGGPVLKLDVATTNPDDSFVSGDGAFVKFNQSGQLVTPSSLEMEIDWASEESFASNSTITLDLGTVGTKTGLSIGGDSFELSSTSQDGVGFSPFESVSVNEEGVVLANFANGSTIQVFRIPLADFANADGLAAKEGNAYLPTLDSGEFFLNVAGAGGTGTISPGSLEQSTVDIAREFANMIITQRAFSSASTVITTADEMLQELVQLKR